MRSGRSALNVGCGGDSYGTNRLDATPGTEVTEVGLATALPYRTAVFDRVLAANVLEHLQNPGEFLNEAARVLKPGGRLEVVADHAGYLGYHLRGWRGGDYHHYQGARPFDRHYMLFHREHLCNLADCAGLDWRQLH